MSFQTKTVFYFATVLLPELEENPELKNSFNKNFNELFSGLEDESRKQLSLLITLISVLSFVYTLKRFEKLNYLSRKKFVKQLFAFPYSKVVGGLNGLKSICFISFYGIEDVWRTIKYEGPLV